MIPNKAFNFTMIIFVGTLVIYLYNKYPKVVKKHSIEEEH
jgi:hypothetical protein